MTTRWTIECTDNFDGADITYLSERPPTEGFATREAAEAWWHEHYQAPDNPGRVPEDDGYEMWPRFVEV